MENQKQNLTGIDKIRNMIIRGQLIMFPEKLDSWEELILKSFKDDKFLYSTKLIEDALEVMEAIDNYANMDNAIELYNEKCKTRSGGGYKVFNQIILQFSNKGPEFLELVQKDIEPEHRELIEQQKIINAELAETNIKKK